MTTELERPIELRTIDSLLPYSGRLSAAQHPAENSSSGVQFDRDEFRSDFRLKNRRDEIAEVTETDTTNRMFTSENNPDMFPDGGKDAYITLFGSFVGLIVDFGIANSMGAIESYVSSHQLQDIKDTRVSWVFTLHIGVMYFGCVFFGELFDRFGAKKLLFLSTIIMSAGIFLTAESTKLIHFIFSFGILTAIGTSLGMTPLVGVLSHWFLRKRAFACSVATTGGLVGSSIFAVMLQKLYVIAGFKWALRTYAFICLFCMGVATVTIRERNVRHTPSTPESEVSEIAFETEPESKLLQWLEFFKGALDLSICKDIRFIYVVLAVSTSEVLSLTSLTYLTSYALDYGVKNSTAYLLITLVNVCGIPSRFLTGILADKYGRFNVMFVMSVLTTIVIFGLWLPAGGNVSLLYVFSVLFGICTSATISLIPATTSQICSTEQFGKVYGTLYFLMAFFTIIFMYVASVIMGQRGTRDYRNFIIFEGVLSCVAIITWLLARHRCVGWQWCKF